MAISWPGTARAPRGGGGPSRAPRRAPGAGARPARAGGGAAPGPGPGPRAGGGPRAAGRARAEQRPVRLVAVDAHTARGEAGIAEHLGALARAAASGDGAGVAVVHDLVGRREL